MPTNTGSDEQRLSAILKQTEPPRSPAHLDDLILQHARRTAEEQRNHTKSVAVGWYGQNWKSMVGVVSVAVIAISFSLQIFNQDLQVPSDLSDLALRVNAPEQDDLRLLVAAESVTTIPITDADAANEVAAQSSSTVAAASTSERLELVQAEPAADDSVAGPAKSRQSDSIDAVAPTTADLNDASVGVLVVNDTSPAANFPRGGRQVEPQLRRPLATAAEPISREITAPTAGLELIEEAAQNRATVTDAALNQVIVTRSLVSGGTASVAASAAAAPPELLTLINADWTNQQRFLEFLAEVLLLDEDETSVADRTTDRSRQSLSDAVRSLLQAYAQLAEPAAQLLSTQRYRQLKLDYSDFPLPETLDQAIALVAELEFINN